MLNEFLTDLFKGQTGKALSLLESRPVEQPVPPDVITMLRLAILQRDLNFLTCQRLHNLWTRWGRPALKPNATPRKVLLLSDFTADNFVPLVTLFCAAQGVEAEVILPGFDSIEQTVLDPTSSLYRARPDIVILFFSDHWLRRYTGNAALVRHSDLEQAQETLSNLVREIESNSPADILVGNLPGRAYPLPAGTVAVKDRMGWNLAVTRFNDWLARRSSTRVHVVDLAEAVFGAGGRQAVGATNFLRARMAYETSGTLSTARELGSGIAHICGKTHRALVSDWDNTLWGGEVAEVGSFGVECGQESPDALGYYMVQEYLKSLQPLGILLAGISRNDPAVSRIFDDNPEMALKLDDFSSLQIGWNPKSESVARVSKELGFGPEFMVFLDDSLYEIAEVLTSHPYMDAVLAGPDSQSTLARLTRMRLFNAVSLSEEDLKRSSRALKLREQRELQSSFGNIEDFLKAIQVRLNVSPLNVNNLERVVQMFQKTNQFNLTTRRHREDDLKQLEKRGGNVFAFSYEDTFGSQGLISIVNLVPEDDAVFIESWLMSCRVLNRTVEQAIFSFIVQKAKGKRVRGEFIPTEKNGLVRNLYPGLGFRNISRDEPTGTEYWVYDGPGPGSEPPKHFTTIQES